MEEDDDVMDQLEEIGDDQRREIQNRTGVKVFDKEDSDSPKRVGNGRATEVPASGGGDFDGLLDDSSDDGQVVR